MSGVISGGRNPAISSLLRDKEAGKVKANTNLIKIIINLNKVKEEIKILREIISFLTRNLQIPNKTMINFPRPAHTLAKEKKKKGIKEKTGKVLKEGKKNKGKDKKKGKGGEGE